MWWKRKFWNRICDRREVLGVLRIFKQYTNSLVYLFTLRKEHLFELKLTGMSSFIVFLCFVLFSDTNSFLFYFSLLIGLVIILILQLFNEWKYHDLNFHILVYKWKPQLDQLHFQPLTLYQILFSFIVWFLFIWHILRYHGTQPDTSMSWERN